jgi:hypothetical protein
MAHFAEEYMALPTHEAQQLLDNFAAEHLK